ncbi:hypothetical protein XENTR_v10016969 [Xenopus tropicalis]|nr:hypothetical protein XENTR_v10016969 [Xenopus tropicalis]
MEYKQCLTFTEYGTPMHETTYWLHIRASKRLSTALLHQSKAPNCLYTKAQLVVNEQRCILWNSREYVTEKRKIWKQGYWKINIS